MGRIPTRVLYSACHDTFPLSRTALQQAAQKGRLVVHTSTTAHTYNCPLATNLHLVHHRLMVGVEWHSI